MAPSIQNHHPEYERILTAAVRLFKSGVGIRFGGTVYRAANPKYAAIPDLISGRGSMLTGSRWNPPGTLRVLHTSDSPEQAMSENLENYRRSGIRVPSDLHIVVRAIHVDVQHILDLRDGSIRHALRVSEDRMLTANWMSENALGNETVSQAVGRAVATAGFRGLRAPSAAVAKKINTVLFVDLMGPKDVIVAGNAK